MIYQMEYGCKSYLNNLWCFFVILPYKVMWNFALCCWSSSCYSLNVYQRCVRKSDCIGPSLYTVRNLEKVLVQSLDQMEHQGHHLACGLNNGTEDHIFWIASLAAIIPILCSTYSIPLFTLSRVFVESMACILYFCRERSSASDIPEFYISMSDMYASCIRSNDGWCMCSSSLWFVVGWKTCISRRTYRWIVKF